MADAKRVFRTNSAGALALDERTRLRMEALFALTDPVELTEAKQRALEELPATAMAEAADLLQEYANYQQAQLQAYRPGDVPSTDEAAAAQLEGMHALRVAHFGSSAAEALFGVEERRARELLELMRLEKDQSLTMAEKAQRAQQMRDRLPNIAALEGRNRQQGREASH